MARFLLAWSLVIKMVAMTSALELPEELTGERCSHPHTINLPLSRKCLVPVTTAYEWTVAQTKCEQVKGTLYMLPSGSLNSRPRLLKCLESMDGEKFDDMWINGVSLWSPQFRWINGSVFNQAQYCPSTGPQLASAQNITSSLSTDACVTECSKANLTYSVLQTTSESLQCYCAETLQSQHRVACPSPDIDFQMSNQIYILPSKQDYMIEVSKGSSFSTTDILCAYVDNSTFAPSGRIQSESCFTRRSFLCLMTSTQRCVRNPSCTSQNCNFFVGDRCVQRVNFPYSWYSARNFCKMQGGDLWVYRHLSDLRGLSKYVTSDTKYWVGATNYQWQFDANSAKLYPLHGDFRTARCAHIYRRRLSSGVLTRNMEWSDTPCDQAKSFLCEFDRDRFKPSEINEEVTCPWPIIEGPTVEPETKTVVVVEDDDSFPLAALISGLVAGLVLLTCLGLTFGLCCGGRRKVAKDRVAFVPYFAGDTSHVEFETMSNADHARVNMRSASEHGSQTGLVKGGYHGSSYGLHNSHAEFSSKSLDRRHLEAMERKFSDSQQHFANSSMDQQAMSHSYQTMPSKGKEYMTLQANMTIQDEAELERMRRSLRGKPEVTLVTDSMDMNFTVNHAHGNSRTERSTEDIHMTSSPSGYEHRNRSFADIALHDL